MRRPLPLSALALLAVLSMAGCDAALTSDTVVLSSQISTDSNGRPIRFGFAAGSVSTGRLVDISCGCTVDIGAFLADRGFAKTDIVSATVTSARLVMLFPISERINFLNQAILKFQASGNSATEVANLSTFPDSREVNLTAQSSRNVAGFLDGSGFQPTLQIDAARLINGADYEIGLVMDIRIEVEGL